MIVGDRLVELLVKNGVEKVFGLPGGQTLPLYDGIRKQRGRVKHILMRDERSAGFAADAYARLTHKVGVCDATVGPGATNLVSPLAEAYCSSIPVLAIVSDIPRTWEHRRTRGNASQAIHQLDIFKPISKWQASIIDPAALDDIVETAFRIATTGRPGPVVLAIPDDIGPMDYAFDSYQPQLTGASFPRYRQAPDLDGIKQAILLLQQKRKVVLVAGGGLHISGVSQIFQDFVEQLQVPVVTTVSGKGIILENHPQSFGVVGTFGNPVANKILQQADLIFYLGCKIGQLTTLRFQYPLKSTQVIHLDSDPEEIGRNYPNSTAILSDALLGIEALLSEIKGDQFNSEWNLKPFHQERQEWYQNQVQQPPALKSVLKPQAVINAVNQILTKNDLVVCDASLASGWASAYLNLNKGGQRMIAPRGLATLGWGAPAAIAAALFGKQDKRILHLAGDGGFAYSVQELETMVRLKLPVVTLVFNNSTLAWIKHIQRDRYQENYISTDFNTVDFAKVAEGFGVKGHNVCELDELKFVLEQNAKPTEPVVISITTDQWETPVLAFE